MSDYEKANFAKDNAKGVPPSVSEHPTWRKIREWSVLEFVNRVSRYLDGENDRALRAELYTTALRDGHHTFTWNRMAWSGAMILDAWRKSFEMPVVGSDVVSVVRTTTGDLLKSL